MEQELSESQTSSLQGISAFRKATAVLTQRQTTPESTEQPQVLSSEESVPEESVVSQPVSSSLVDRNASKRMGDPWQKGGNLPSARADRVEAPPPREPISQPDSDLEENSPLNRFLKSKVKGTKSSTGADAQAAILAPGLPQQKISDPSPAPVAREVGTTQTAFVRPDQPLPAVAAAEASEAKTLNIPSTKPKADGSFLSPQDSRPATDPFRPTEMDKLGKAPHQRRKRQGVSLQEPSPLVVPASERGGHWLDSLASMANKVRTVFPLSSHDSEARVQPKQDVRRQKIQNIRAVPFGADESKASHEALAKPVNPPVGRRLTSKEEGRGSPQKPPSSPPAWGADKPLSSPRVMASMANAHEGPGEKESRLQSVIALAQKSIRRRQIMRNAEPVLSGPEKREDSPPTLSMPKGRVPGENPAVSHPGQEGSPYRFAKEVLEKGGRLSSRPEPKPREASLPVPEGPEKAVDALRAERTQEDHPLRATQSGPLKFGKPPGGAEQTPKGESPSRSVESEKGVEPPPQAEMTQASHPFRAMQKGLVKGADPVQKVSLPAPKAQTEGGTSLPRAQRTQEGASVGSLQKGEKRSAKSAVRMEKIQDGSPFLAMNNAPGRVVESPLSMDLIREDLPKVSQGPERVVEARVHVDATHEPERVVESSQPPEPIHEIPPMDPPAAEKIVEPVPRVDQTQKGSPFRSPESEKGGVEPVAHSESPPRSAESRTQAVPSHAGIMDRPAPLAPDVSSNSRNPVVVAGKIASQDEGKRSARPAKPAPVIITAKVLSPLAIAEKRDRIITRQTSSGGDFGKTSPLSVSPAATTCFLHPGEKKKAKVVVTVPRMGQTVAISQGRISLQSPGTTRQETPLPRQASPGQGELRSVSMDNPGLEEGDERWQVPVEGLGQGISTLLGDAVGFFVSTASLKRKSIPVAPIQHLPVPQKRQGAVVTRGKAGASMDLHRVASRVTGGIKGIFSGTAQVATGGVNIVLGTLGFLGGAVYYASGAGKNRRNAQD